MPQVEEHCIAKRVVSTVFAFSSERMTWVLAKKDHLC